MGDIDLPSGTTAPLYGSGDLATLGLGAPPPLPTRLYKLASRRARLLMLYVLRLLRLTLSLLVYVFAAYAASSSVRGCGFYSRFRLLHLLLRRLGAAGSSSAEYTANEQRFSRALKSDTGAKSTAQ